MNHLQQNIQNLFALWEVAGRALGNYSEQASIGMARLPGSEWPNRLWSTSPLSPALVERIRGIMKTYRQLTFSNIVIPEEKDLLADDPDFDLTVVQQGMSLPLTQQFVASHLVDLKRVTNREEAVLWQQGFQQAFGYTIDAETILKTKTEIQYYLGLHQQTLVGTVVLFPTPPAAGLHSLGIVPTQRKKGFATDIMHQILNKAMEQHLSLATLQASAMAEDLYLKMGFTIDFTMKNYTIKIE